MEILFLLVGLIFFAFGLLIIFFEVRARLGALELPGQIIGYSTGRKSSDDRSFHSVAKYVGPDGRNRYVEATVGSSSPLDAIGDTVTVLTRPGVPEKAVIKSSLTFVMGGVIAVMGLVSSIVFFNLFHGITTLSLAAGAPALIWGAWKVRTSLRDKPMPLQEWKTYKSTLLATGTSTEETKGEISWASPAALEDALQRERKTNRFAIPFLLLTGTGLLLLGAHLHQTTDAFLETAVKGSGTVVELVDHAPVVEFEYQARTFRFKDSVSSNPPSHRKGDTVTVLYDPSRPDNARIDRGLWNRVIPILVAGLGAVFSLLGISVILRRRGKSLD